MNTNPYRKLGRLKYFESLGVGTFEDRSLYTADDIVVHIHENILEYNCLYTHSTG